jgi:dTDP-4-dehydrorhamnose 3,5-epimerase-like enzyme
MLKKIQLLSFPKILDNRGNLSFIEQGKHLPFDIKRVYMIYDVPGGEKRGGHAFKQQHEVIISLSGSFDIVATDGQEKQVFSLNRSYSGVYVPPLFWRNLENFSTNAVALVLASTFYDEADYIRDFDQFIQLSQHAAHSI